MESTSHILRKMILKIMSDGEERSLDEIKKAIDDQGWTYDMDYSEGHLAGTMRKLRTSGQLEKVARGRYRLGREVSEVPKVSEDPKASKASEALEATNVSEVSESSGGQSAHPRLIARSELLILKKAVLSDLEKQYNRLVRQLDTRTLSSLDPKEFACVMELLELKKDLEKILKKNQ